MFSRDRGFTLIELLMVIAIIGILASIAIGSLTSARDKGVNAAIISNITNVRNQAEVYFERYNIGYADLCDDESLVDVATSTNAIGGSFACESSTLEYRFSSILIADEGYFCVDTTGFANTVTTEPSGLQCN